MKIAPGFLTASLPHTYKIAGENHSAGYIKIGSPSRKGEVHESIEK
jgi:hypothetical protein